MATVIPFGRVLLLRMQVVAAAEIAFGGLAP